MRLIQLARRFPRLRKVTTALLRACIESLLLVLLLMAFMFICMVLGMQLFGKEIDMAEPVRFSFRSLWQSGYTVFIIITGENWSEMMAVTMQKTSWAAVFYYIFVFVTGRYILVNLFICILIDSLRDYSRRCEEDLVETLKVASAIAPPATEEGADIGQHSQVPVPVPSDSPYRVAKPPALDYGVCNGQAESRSKQGGALRGDQEVSALPHQAAFVEFKKEVDNGQPGQADGQEVKARADSSYDDRLDRLAFLEDKIVQGDFATSVSYISPTGLDTQPGFRGWCKRIAEHKILERVILMFILCNALFLAADTPWTQGNCFQDPCDQRSMILYVSDVFFTAIFLMEILVQLCAYGPRQYLANASNLTDCFVVLTSMLGLLIPILKICRALRTIRLISRVPSLKAAVQSLFRALPALGTVHVALACLWLLFGILGVQLLMGRFWYCKDVNRQTLPLNQESCLSPNTWARDRWDFDNLGVAFISLTIICWGEGWDVYLWKAVDSTPAGLAPEIDASPVLGLFFIGFFVVGGFLSINLFAATLIDEFLNRKDDQSQLTEEQKKFLKNTRVMLAAKLPTVYARPNARWRCKIARVVDSPHFETFINIAILLNMLVMTLEHYQQSATWTAVLYDLNIVFVALFACEAALKITAYGLRGYLSEAWSKFDFFLVLASLAALPFDGPGASILRTLRMFRLINRFEGMRVCAVTLLFALPGLVNILALMLVLVFMFAVAGVQLFGRIHYDDDVFLASYPNGLNSNLNFSDMYYSFFLLLALSTYEGWSQMMESCMENSPGCDLDGSCGTAAAVPYFLLFMIVSSCILANAIVTTVVSHFNDAMDSGQRVLAALKMRWAFLDQDQKKSMPADRFVLLLRMLSTPNGPVDWRNYTDHVPNMSKTSGLLDVFASKHLGIPSHQSPPKGLLAARPPSDPNSRP